MFAEQVINSYRACHPFLPLDRWIVILLCSGKNRQLLGVLLLVVFPSRVGGLLQGMLPDAFR